MVGFAQNAVCFPHCDSVDFKLCLKRRDYFKFFYPAFSDNTCRNCIFLSDFIFRHRGPVFFPIETSFLNDHDEMGV